MSHHNHQFHFRYFLSKEINEVYVMNTIRSFAESMIGIFVPIFLLKQGFAFSLVLLFLLSWAVFVVILCFVALRLISRYGVKHSIYISIPVTILYFLSLHQFSYLQLFLSDVLFTLLLGFLFALSVATFWMGFHLEFARFSSRKKSARQLGILNILSTVFSVFGPLVGALIITFFSFNVLFVIVMVLLLVSIIPLLFSKETHEPFTFNVGNALFKNFRKGIPYLGEAFNSGAANFFWPVLLFVITISLNGIGGVYAISNAVLVLFTWIISRHITLSNRHHILNIGAYLHSASLVVRVFLRSFAPIAAVQGVGALSIAMVHLPFHSIFYNNSKKRGYAQTIFFREVYLGIGKVLLFSLAGTLLLFLPLKETLMFTIVLGGLLMMLVSRIREE